MSANQRVAESRAHPGALSQRPSDVKPWSPKPSLLRRLIAPIRDEGEGSGHKWSRNRRRAAPGNSRRERQSQFASPARRSQAMVAKAFPPPAPHCPDPGQGRRKRAQMEPESATRRAGRFAAQKAIPIRFAGAPQSGHGRQSVPSLGSSAPRSGTRRRKRAQTQPESATRRAARFVARKAIPIRSAGAPQKGGSESGADKCRRQLHGLTP